jgi:hypothetical protein
MRNLLMAVGAGIFALSAAAAPSPAAESALDKLYACAAIADGVQRLACFDAETARLKASETKGEFAAVDQAKIKEVQKEAFGFSLPSLPRLGLLRGAPTEELPAQEAVLKSISRGYASIYTLSNGQVWRQVDSERDRHFKLGEEVVIERAAMGSFLMSRKKGGGAAVRVRREQ